MSSREEEINDSLNKLNLIKNAMEMALSHNDEIVRTAAWMNRKLAGNIASLSFMQTLYGKASSTGVESMNEETYDTWVLPLKTTVVRGEPFIGLSEDLRKVTEKYVSIAGAFSFGSATIASSTGDSATNLILLGPAFGYSKDQIQLALEKYMAETKVDDDIEYVRQQLVTVDKEAAEDFEHFLTNYFAQTESLRKYQDLIGLRSLLFFKLIFSYADRFGITVPPYKRIDQISQFIRGPKGKSDPNVVAVAELVKDLWNELSDQDPSGLSVKTATVTGTYIELLFRKLITIISALFRQRVMSFSS